MLKQVKIVRKNKRRGRGYGSGRGGHTVGFGQKGQKSRGRGKPGIIHEGGRVPIHRKLPKLRGAELKPKTRYRGITLKELAVKLRAYLVANPQKSVIVIDKKRLIELGFKPIGSGFKIIGTLAQDVPANLREVLQNIKIVGVAYSKGVAKTLGL